MKDCRVAGAGNVAKRSAKRTPSSAASWRTGNPTLGSASALEEPEGQAEIDGQLEVDVEELRSHDQGIEMAMEMTDVESPQHGSLDLGPAFSDGPRRYRRDPTDL